jgi:hypothetical protein
MALIAGAKTFHQVKATLRVSFWKVMRVSWITSPICLAFAQKFLPQDLWVPFFNIVSFIIGTYINTVTKKKRLAALRKKHFGEGPRGPAGAGSGSTIGGPTMGGPTMGGHHRPEDYPPLGPQPPLGPNPPY